MSVLSVSSGSVPDWRNRSANAVGTDGKISGTKGIVRVLATSPSGIR